MSDSAPDVRKGRVVIPRSSQLDWIAELDRRTSRPGTVDDANLTGYEASPRPTLDRADATAQPTRPIAVGKMLRERKP
jgi:hypothetical protein